MQVKRPQDRRQFREPLLKVSLRIVQELEPLHSGTSGLSRAVSKENAAVTRGGATILPSKESTLRQGLLIMRMPMMDVRIVRMGVGQLAVVMDVGVGAHLEGRPAGANADGARRASEDARE